MYQTNLMWQRVHIKAIQCAGDLVPSIQRIGQRFQPETLGTVGGRRAAVDQPQVLVRQRADFAAVVQLHYYLFLAGQPAEPGHGAGAQGFAGVGARNVLHLIAPTETAAEFRNRVRFNPAVAPANPHETRRRFRICAAKHEAPDFAVPLRVGGSYAATGHRDRKGCLLLRGHSIVSRIASRHSPAQVIVPFAGVVPVLPEEPQGRPAGIKQVEADTGYPVPLL